MWSSANLFSVVYRNIFGWDFFLLHEVECKLVGALHPCLYNILYLQGYFVQTRGLGQTWTICCWYHQTKNTQKGSSGNLTFRQGRTVCKYLTVKGSTLSLLVCLLSKSTFLGGQVEALQIFRDTFFMKLAQECVHVCVSSIPVTANVTLYATYFICET